MDTMIILKYDKRGNYSSHEESGKEIIGTTQLNTQDLFFEELFEKSALKDIINIRQFEKFIDEIQLFKSPVYYKSNIHNIYRPNEDSKGLSVYREDLWMYEDFREWDSNEFRYKTDYFIQNLKNEYEYYFSNLWGNLPKGEPILEDFFKKELTKIEEGIVDIERGFTYLLDVKHNPRVCELNINGEVKKVSNYETILVYHLKQYYWKTSNMYMEFLQSVMDNLLKISINDLKRGKISNKGKGEFSYQYNNKLVIKDGKIIDNDIKDMRSLVFSKGGRFLQVIVTEEGKEEYFIIKGK